MGITKLELRKYILDIIAIPYPDENVGDTDDSVVLADEFGFGEGDYLDIILELKFQHGLIVKNPDYSKFTTLGATVDYIYDQLYIAS